MTTKGRLVIVSLLISLAGCGTSPRETAAEERAARYQAESEEAKAQLLASNSEQAARDARRRAAALELELAQARKREAAVIKKADHDAQKAYLDRLRAVRDAKEEERFRKSAAPSTGL